jgi:hypothetical protein
MRLARMPAAHRATHVRSSVRPFGTPERGDSPCTRTTSSRVPAPAERHAASVLPGPLYPGRPMSAASAPPEPLRMAIPFARVSSARSAVRQAARALRDL